MEKYRSTAKVYKGGNLYWDIEVYKKDRWEVLLPYLSLDEAIYFMQNQDKIKSMRRLINIAHASMYLLIATTLFVVWLVLS